MIEKVNIPTNDLLGLLADVLPFAADPKLESALAVVRIQWDGELLHAEATNRYAGGRSSWDPDEAPDDDARTDLFTAVGGGDEPWTIYIPAESAKGIMTDFKLPPKEAPHVMVTMTCDVEAGRFEVFRERAGKRDGVRRAINGEAEVKDFPEAARTITQAALDGGPRISTVSYNPAWLEPFTNVRTRGGHLTFNFATERMTACHVGHRFIGWVVPVRERDPRDDVAAALVTAGAEVDDGPFMGDPDRWLGDGSE